MKIISVETIEQEKQFLNIARVIYKNDTNWICPLDIEILDIFKKENNKKLEFGEAKRWILIDNNNNLIGRIASFYDKRRAFKEHPYAGGCGFFECINNFDAAKLLFDTAKEWLVSKGMEAMDGPVNFGENYVNQGLLINGFIQQGYGMPYNKPYYKTLFEQYGFKTYFEMYSYHIDLTKPLPQRQVRFAEFITRKENYKFDHIRFNNYEKYLNDIVTIYNDVWSHFHDDYIPLEYDEIEKMLIEAKPLLNEDFIWFVYDIDRPIGMIITFPDINQILKKLDGKLDFLGKLKFLFAKSTTKITRARQLISGVIPEYQKTGIISGLFIKMVSKLKEHGIKELEMSWVGDYNITVNKMYKQIEGVKAKTHVTYRYLFDQNAEFKRFMAENIEKQQDK